MTEYDYVKDFFRPSDGETVDIPEDAVGVTVSTFGDPGDDGIVSVRYLAPVTEDSRDA